MLVSICHPLNRYCIVSTSKKYARIRPDRICYQQDLAYEYKQHIAAGNGGTIRR